MFLFGWPPSVALQYILNAFLHEKKKIVWVFLSQHRITLLLPLSLSFSCLLTIHSYQQWPEERVQSVKPAAKSLQLCPTLCNPKDCSPPGSYVQEILQARILEWVAVPFSMSEPWGKPEWGANVREKSLCFLLCRSLGNAVCVSHRLPLPFSPGTSPPQPGCPRGGVPQWP